MNELFVIYSLLNGSKFRKTNVWEYFLSKIKDTPSWETLYEVIPTILQLILKKTRLLCPKLFLYNFTLHSVNEYVIQIGKLL